MRDDRPAPRQQLLLAAVIAAPALSGSIGAMRVGRGPCAVVPAPFDTSGAPIAPLGPLPATAAP